MAPVGCWDVEDGVDQEQALGPAPRRALLALVLGDLCSDWLWFCPAELNLNENAAAERLKQKESGQRG